jgi:hypothetical protein
MLKAVFMTAFFDSGKRGQKNTSVYFLLDPGQKHAGMTTKFVGLHKRSVAGGCACQQRQSLMLAYDLAHIWSSQACTSEALQAAASA